MKRHLLVCLTSGLILAFASVLMAGEKPGTGIQYTSHDLSRNGADAYAAGAEAVDIQNRICVFCHASHHATAPADINHYPIWSQSTATIVSFQTYANGVNTAGQPGSVSQLCLSCHDGSIACNIYGNFPPGAIKYADERWSTGKILTQRRLDYLLFKHPIGFDYRDVSTKHFGFNPATSPLLGTKTGDMTINDLLWDGRIECSSCHDVHNAKNEGRKFTWTSDIWSRFCFTCHKK